MAILFYRRSGIKLHFIRPPAGHIDTFFNQKILIIVRLCLRFFSIRTCQSNATGERIKCNLIPERLYGVFGIKLPLRKFRNIKTA